MTSLPYAQLIDIKRWADRGLYEAVRRNLDALPPEDVSIMLRILDHIHVVDRIFQHHLQGTPHDFLAPRSQGNAAVRGAGGQRTRGRRLVRGLCRRVDRGPSSKQPLDFVFTSGKPARMRRGEIILHVCLHGTYHRGNAGAVLQLKGLTPSRDAITDFLEEAA